MANKRALLNSWAVLLALLSEACGLFGNITTGNGNLNDPEPSGTIVAQGPFAGFNGRTVTGNVSVYKQASNASTCNFVVRIQSLSAPDDELLQLVPIVNGAPVSPQYYYLRTASGNQNYTFTGGDGSCSSAFAQVQVINPRVFPVSAQSYGIANLTPL